MIKLTKILNEIKIYNPNVTIPVEKVLDLINTINITPNTRKLLEPYLNILDKYNIDTSDIDPENYEENLNYFSSIDKKTLFEFYKELLKFTKNNPDICK